MMSSKIAFAVTLAAMFALGGAAGASSSASDQLAATMKAKLAASKGGGTVQPTGIEVPGCTWYVNNEPSGHVRSYCHANDARDPKLFFDVQDRNGAGSSGNQ
jgi:hypothetical protein